MLRKLGSLFAVAWMVLVRICRSIVGKREKQKKEDQPNKSENNKEWKTDWEEWEMTEVKVEPATPTSPMEEPPDLFKDMVPVIHTTKKIHFKGTGPSQAAPNLNQFAFDPSFKATSSELLEWSDGENDTGGTVTEGGWTNEEERDLPELLRQSRRQTGQKKRETDPRNPTKSGGVAIGGGTHGLGATKITS